MVGMAPTAFSRFFKQRTGKKLSDYITDIRLGTRARCWLTLRCQWRRFAMTAASTTLSNFNRIFKRKKSCPPTEFRETYFKKKVII